MPLPTPAPGLVIRYAYLWHDEHQRGQIEGTKDRPCAIILVRRVIDDETEVTVLPVTHTPPSDADSAIEIPHPTKHRLGLDDERSWVILTEVNTFIWPGPDLRPVTAGSNQQFDYGFLPPGFFRQLRDRFIELVKLKQAKQTRRDS